jgi:glycosyltransferase involved in cell wall biosynthesis
MLSSAGMEVAVYSFQRDGHAYSEALTLFTAEEHEGITSKRNLTGLRNCISKFQPRVIINQMPYEHAITDVLFRFPNIKRIACLHNTLYSVRNNLEAYATSLFPPKIAPIFTNTLGKFLLLLIHRIRHARDLRRILFSYHKFVLFAEPNLDELRYFVPKFSPNKIALIPNSIPTVASFLPVKEKRILWLGRVVASQKRADLILPIWRELGPKLPDWTLDVVGDGPLLSRLQAESEAAGLERIVFHGKQPSAPFFERSAVYIMTSDFEGFPNTLIEAQSYGAVPVVFDSYPIASWLVRSEENGVLVTKNDVVRLTERLFQVCSDERALGYMAANSLTNARGYTEEKVSLHWQALLNNLLCEK